MSRTQELYTLWAVDLSPSGLAALNLLADGRFKLETKTEQDIADVVAYVKTFSKAP